MSNATKHESTNGRGSFERQDLRPSSIMYFLMGLAVATTLCVFALRYVYAFLDRHEAAQQPPVSPLVTNVPSDTRHLPPAYKGDYEKYLKANFPVPQLEINERTELNDARLHEEQTLYSYGWVDQKTGIVRIPIDRAMDLLVQRGLLVEIKTGERPDSTQSSGTNAAAKRR